MAIQNTTLTSTAADILPSTGNRAITVMYFYNSDASTVTINLFAVPNGETLGAEHTIYGQFEVLSNDTLVVDTEKLLLDDGDALRATATTDNVVHVTCSYTNI